MEEILSKNNNISFIDNLCLTEITNSKDFNKENMDINLNRNFDFFSSYIFYTLIFVIYYIKIIF